MNKLKNLSIVFLLLIISIKNYESKRKFYWTYNMYNVTYDIISSFQQKIQNYLKHKRIRSLYKCITMPWKQETSNVKLWTAILFVYVSTIISIGNTLLLFIVKPTIQVGQMEPAQAYGYQKTLECVIEAYPVPSEDQITWTHENIPVPSR